MYICYIMVNLDYLVGLVKEEVVTLRVFRVKCLF